MTFDQTFSTRERWQTKSLGFADFTAGAQIANVLTPVARLKVPANHVYALLAGERIGLYLKGIYEAATPVNANVDVTINLASAGFLIDRSTRKAPAFPTQAHPDVHAFISSDGGATWAATNVLAVDFDLSTVQITKTGSTNRVRIYALPREGELEIRANIPGGGSRVDSRILNLPIAYIHEVDQTNVRTAPKLDIASVVPIPEDWTISIEARCPVLIPWVAEAKHSVEFRVKTAQVTVFDAPALNTLAEQAIRRV